VILLRRGGRHGDRGVEVLMLKRGADAKFMPGVWVFAGGVVDPEDRADATDPPAGIDADEWAHRICGARELAEEGGIELEASGLHAWSRWVTPEPVPKRFDTRFYIALAPPHARPEPDHVEMDEARWIAPAEALRASGENELEISFPTIRHLEELVEFDAADDVIAATDGRVVEAILPKIVGDRSSYEVLLPGQAGYPED
jgi:hypothetical protein